MTELINRVAASSIVSLNMEEFYPQEERIVFDLAAYLEQGLVLREKEFRAALKAKDWQVASANHLHEFHSCLSFQYSERFFP
jgi:hypothetical protein